MCNEIQRFWLHAEVAEGVHEAKVVGGELVVLVTHANGWGFLNNIMLLVLIYYMVGPESTIEPTIESTIYAIFYSALLIESQSIIMHHQESQVLPSFS